MKKTVLSIILILVISFFVGMNKVYADDSVNEIIGAMNGTSAMDNSGTGIKSTINNIIGLIQIAGTGISIIVVTMLGIKYLLASPSEKADVKKQITPILIGCVLLFGAVNLVGMIADFTEVLKTN